MRKGFVVTKADGTKHLLEVEGDIEAGIDRRIAEEVAKFPDRRASAICVPGEALWVQNFEAPPPPPRANGPGFERALMGIFPATAGRNDLLVRYPLFLWALRGGAWADAQTIVEDAKLKLAITPAQYDQVIAAARSNNIPGF